MSTKKKSRLWGGKKVEEKREEGKMKRGEREKG